MMTIVLQGCSLGLFLGLFFFVGLWLTTWRLEKSKASGIFFLASFIFRSFIVIYAIYFFADNNPFFIVSTLLAFLLSRFIATNLVKCKGGKHARNP